MNALEPLEKLTALLARLPGVGRRSAQRMALKIARDPARLGDDLIQALRDVRESIRICSLCGNLTLAGQDPCALCSDPRRDAHTLCVVEDPGDILVVEQAGTYRGRYHALMGKLAPGKGQGRQQLRMDSLLNRVDQEQITEVILALNADVESDATAQYLRELLASRSVRVTRLAFGIPAGSGIAYSDPVTLTRALQGRVDMK